MAGRKPLAVVLGGGGFIGTNLVKRLVAEDRYAVRAVDVEWRPERLEALDGAYTMFADLQDPYACEDAVESADVVYHFAADMGGVGYFHSDKDFGAALYNGLLTNNVIRAVSKRPGTKLLYASSACALATENQYTKGLAPKLTESALYWGTPDQRYGAEKRYGAYLCENAPFDARVAIFHTVYGPYQEHDGIRMKFPSSVAVKALQARQTGELELWGDGSQLRSYLYIDDAIDRIIKLSELSSNPGPVNIGSENAVTCTEVAEMCLDIAGVKDAKIIYNDKAPSGVLGRNADCSKFWDVTHHYKTETTLREGFEKFMAYLEEVI